MTNPRAPTKGAFCLGVASERLPLVASYSGRLMSGDSSISGI